MAKKQSIVGLHAEVTARASQFISEYERADNASRRRNASIRAEIGKTAESIKRAFSIPNLAKGVLGGLGIGSGVALATTVIEAIAGHFRESAERAKKMGEYVEKMRDDLREIAQTRFENFIGNMPDGPEKVGAIERRIKEVTRQRDAATKERENARDAIKWADVNARTEWAHKKWGEIGVRAVGDRAQEEIDKQQTVIDALERQLDALDAKRESTVESAAKKRAEAMSKWLKPYNDKIEADHKRAEAAAEKVRDTIATPAEKFAEAIKVLPGLLERGLKKLPGGISYDQAQRFQSRAWAQFEEESDPSKNAAYQRWEKAAGGMRVDDYTRRGLGSGANYQDVARQTNSILAEIRELVRRAISNPRPTAPAFGA